MEGLEPVEARLEAGGAILEQPAQAMTPLKR
jgi:hypothetical protein